MKHSILVVDDESDNVDALERLFRRKYNVFKAVSADEGLAIVRENKVSLIISDQRMPKKTGVEFLKDSQKYVPEAMRILLTGYTDIDSVIDAINSGEVYRYITKPWDPVDLTNTVDKAIERYELSAELKEKNAALARALDELRTLDEAKSNFMILINHELKTPLTVILSFLELLRESSLSAEQTKYVARILTSAEKLKHILDDVLTFVSAETGLTKVSRKKISLEKLFGDVAVLFTEAAAAKKIKIKSTRKDVSVKADPKLIGDVLRRLVDNAIKFGREGSVVELKCESVDDGVEIVVVNEGKSIPAKLVEKLLKPFTLDEDIMKHSQGLGMGLSVSQALLKLHGSQLQIESAKGSVRVSFVLKED